MSALPFLKLYPKDWLSDAALQSCSLYARGLWAEMCFVMHGCEPYGHLVRNGKPMSVAALARLLREDAEDISGAIDELEREGVLSRTADGVIFSRRMVRDAEDRAESIASGALGGNPKLGVQYNRPGFLYAIQRDSGEVKIGISTDPRKRVSRLRKVLGCDAEIVAQCSVEDMGEVERLAHEAFSDCCASPGSEWFSIPADTLDALIVAIRGGEVRLRGALKANLSSRARVSAGARTRALPSDLCPLTSAPLDSGEEGGREERPRDVPVDPDTSPPVPVPVLRPPKPPAVGEVLAEPEFAALSAHEPFRAFWEGTWLPHRRETGKSYKPRGAREALRQAVLHGPDVWVAAARQSMANGWQGVFPERMSGKPPDGGPDRLQRYAQELADGIRQRAGGAA